MSERLRAPDLIPHFLNVRANLLAHTGRIAEALATPIDRNFAESLGRQLERTGRILSRLWDPAHGKPWLLEGLGLPAVKLSSVSPDSARIQTFEHWMKRWPSCT